MSQREPAWDPPTNHDSRHGELDAINPQQRARFEPTELARVLREYDLGLVKQIREFPRGSRRSPKVRIYTTGGEYLLKRRAPGRDNPYRVAFAHSLQLALAAASYPVAGLIGTKGENNSLLQRDSAIYEMFRFVIGTSYDHSVAETRRAGAALGRMHRLLDDYQPQFHPPTGSFHAAAGVDARFADAVRAIESVDPSVDRPNLHAVLKYLRKTYLEAAHHVDALGYRHRPPGVIHGDCHPGNLIYRDGEVAAVLDFDSARIEPRLADVANAVLQFTIRVGRPDETASWPEGLDESRITALLEGYHESLGRPLARDELESIPWLMIEALIVECIVPIAATGSFARIGGYEFLEVVQRKVRWIQARAGALTSSVQG